MVLDCLLSKFSIRIQVESSINLTKVSKLKENRMAHSFRILNYLSHYEPENNCLPINSLPLIDPTLQVSETS